MSEENTLFKHYLTCNVCNEIFKDPVSLGCHHSFCSRCLQDFWAQAENKNCPVCKRKSSKDIYVNFSIKELADSYTGKQRSAPSDEAQVVCTEHLKDIKWFCKDEQRAVCHVCELPHHKGHMVVPLEEQVQELKQQLRPDLTALQERRRRHQELEKTYEAMVPRLKRQQLETERRIRAEFDQLYRFLREEEEARVAALREEEEKKRKRILRERKTLQEQISSVSKSLSALEADLQKDGLSFLSASTRSRTSARTLLSGSDPQLLPGALLDEAKHLRNLAPRVWEKMGQRTTFSPVILDPSTASRRLSLSDDLTSVREIDAKQKVPNNPERLTKYTEVLGSHQHTFTDNIFPCFDIGAAGRPSLLPGPFRQDATGHGFHNEDDPGLGSSSSETSLTFEHTNPCTSMPPPQTPAGRSPSPPSARNDDDSLLVPLHGEKSLKRCFEYFHYYMDSRVHKRFFRELDLSDRTINDANSEDRVFELLVVWLEKQGQEAKLHHLLRKLRDFSQNRTADSIIEKAIAKGHYERVIPNPPHSGKGDE